MPTRVDEQRLRLLPYREYRGVNSADPLRFYYWPLLGSVYRRRVELCLSLCQGGARVLEVGFGSGLSFLNLSTLYRQVHGIDLTAQAHEVAAVFRSRGVTPDLLQGSVLHLPYADGEFDTVLLISILEHLQPGEQDLAFSEIRRVLGPAGSVVLGVPVERRLMRWMFRAMRVNIREHHFSTDQDVIAAARRQFVQDQVIPLAIPGLGQLYLVASFTKPPAPRAGEGGRTREAARVH